MILEIVWIGISNLLHLYSTDLRERYPIWIQDLR
jgi:hypothetical protein